jgi:hypothetical protein
MVERRIGVFIIQTFFSPRGKLAVQISNGTPEVGLVIPSEKPVEWEQVGQGRNGCRRQNSGFAPLRGAAIYGNFFP